EAERMTRLVNDLLTLARLDEGRPLEKQPVDLIALVGEAVDQARVLAGGAEVGLATDGGGRLMLTLDPDRIKQVLLVLLDNALKYRRPAPDAWVRVRVGRTEHGAVVSVADNGRGIAAAELPHIFDRFYRGERYAGERRITGAQVAARLPEPPAPADSGSGPQSGSGLGLAIAQAIAQAHGGTLSVESAPGLGTTFTLALPRG
ncbi:MAG TPA: HAMP domain-containing sensor histidine kinase, partial [Ktedonobacterales bacterium]